MVNTIVICPDGHMIPESDCLGRTGEHKATVLRFEFFKDLNGEAVAELEKNLVAVMSEGALPFRINGDFYVPRTITLNPEVILFVEIKKGNEVLFKSTPHVFTLIDTGETEGADIIGTAMETVREECRAELAESLETATGENHDNKTWEELNNTVSTLPITSEEQTQALGDWDLIKDYFADYSRPNHSLFSSGVRNYRLPYIYTPKMQWLANSTELSSYLVEFGVDVSSAQGIGGYSNFNTFANATGLERIVLTGNAMQPSLREFMRNNGNLVYLKMETPSVEVLEQTTGYYLHSFRNCSNLQTIDCELDFTGQTNFGEAFTPLYKLEYFRIKPFTLSTSLNLRFSQRLHISGSADYDSLISILNGITLDEEVAKNITLTFSGAITDFTTNGGFWSKYVYFYGSDGLYHSKPPEVTEGEVYLETYLYNAFINKGVTIAIV